MSSIEAATAAACVYVKSGDNNDNDDAAAVRVTLQTTTDAPAVKPNFMALGSWPSGLEFERLQFDVGGAAPQQLKLHSRHADVHGGQRHCIASLQMAPGSSVRIDSLHQWLDDQNMINDIPLPDGCQLFVSVVGHRMLQQQQQQKQLPATTSDKWVTLLTPTSAGEQQQLEVVQNPDLTLVVDDGTNTNGGDASATTAAPAARPRSMQDAACASVADDTQRYRSHEARSLPFHRTMTFRLVLGLVVVLLILWLLYRLFGRAWSWLTQQ